MEYTYLGRTGLQVSRLVLGTMNFGPETTEEDSFAIMNQALELGINFFDTANVYGWEKGEGVTEQIIGRWLAEDPSRRDQIVLATKVYGPMGDGPNDRGLSAYHIRQAVEGSLRRLQTDHIDLYQMHHIDRNAPWEEVWQAMEQLVQEGKILYVGSSNFAGWNIAQAQAAAEKRNFLGLVSEQSIYNLATREIELEVLPAAQHYGLGIIPWSPLHGGMLAGSQSEASDGRRTSERVQERFEDHAAQIKEYEIFCAEIGVKPAVLSLAWLLDQPAVTGPIVGPRTMEQLESAMEAVSFEMSNDIRDRLDTIWPGPGDQAPEAYAW